MIVHLDQSKIDAYVAQPGVALLNWRSPDKPVSRIFDAGYANVSARHPDVSFADVDASSDPAFTASWAVPGAPELMAYRDGTLVFDYPGALPEQVIDALIDAIWSLDMDRIRQSTNGHGSRLYIAIQPSGLARFELGGGSSRTPTGQSAKH